MSEDQSETHPDDLPEQQVLPLDAWHRARGARMVEFAGYQMPIQYTGEGGGIVAEHEWTRNHAGLFDVSHMGQLVLEGQNAAEALEALVPGDISALKPGRMRYSLLLDENGGILDDLIITNTGEHLALVVNGAVKWDDIAHLREHLPDAITLTHNADLALLALQGPEAGAVLDGLVPGTGALTFMTAAAFAWNDTPLWVSRAGYTGEDGFEISIAADMAEALADALVADDRVNPAGLGARDSLRLEAGLPLYGHDLGPETDPVSAGLLFALSKSRRETGGWMGHAAIARVLASGPATKRVGLVVEGRLPAREGAPVFAGDRQIGRVTSGGFSPTLGYPVAMAYIDAEHAAGGTRVQIEVRGKRLDAQVAPMPFVPHRYYRGDPR
ncbi:glycine cleavage system aminomethyltransferase GcvT [Allopontixanthobacter sp.]|uniref:glycine cleavage system aminomethyltransferase GcvT n=1 Tax=Allopontixanthobacter sp. TaxID=2906452 RepID=UPI002AB99579|nr:glycine cleavage system aminomethyltransferase GcvT [Allopontixanthobacter sp.]MDZ4306375.1 glycine cleavage system aminomethyltransferase GcvT [Allopontixanthobacter sp.]